MEFDGHTPQDDQETGVRFKPGSPKTVGGNEENDMKMSYFSINSCYKTTASFLKLKQLTVG